MDDERSKSSLRETMSLSSAASKLETAATVSGKCGRPLANCSAALTWAAQCKQCTLSLSERLIIHLDQHCLAAIGATRTLFALLLMQLLQLATSQSVPTGQPSGQSHHFTFLPLSRGFHLAAFHLQLATCYLPLSAVSLLLTDTNEPPARILSFAPLLLLFLSRQTRRQTSSLGHSLGLFGPNANLIRRKPCKRYSRRQLLIDRAAAKGLPCSGGGQICHFAKISAP